MMNIKILVFPLTLLRQISRKSHHFKPSNSDFTWTVAYLQRYYNGIQGRGTAIPYQTSHY